MHIIYRIGVFFMSLWTKISSFITKDVHNENEAKKRTIIMRIFILMTCVYCLFLTIVTSITGAPFLPVLSIVVLALYVIIYYCTYINQTKLVVLALQILTYIWIVTYVLLFGWDCGSQHFLFVLLILSYLSGYYSGKTNVFLAVFYCLSRLALFFHCKSADPIYPLDYATTVSFQILTTITIFAQVTLMISMFSKESIETEKKLVSYNAKIKELASIDPLTKLRNRRSMMEYLEGKINRPYEDAAFCLAIADIDFFKKVNDTYGHEAGDEVLREVSKVLKLFMLERGRVARWGGEEFLFFFNNPNGDEVYLEVEELRSIISKTKITYNDVEIPITMTFGLQEYTSYQPLDYTINNADKKLYQGKETGRNKVVF